MRDIPRPIVRAYQAALDRDNVPVEQRPHYVRWLRYYLDFCHKYNHNPEVDASSMPRSPRASDRSTRI
jgi:hypothetical protein